MDHETLIEKWSRLNPESNRGFRSLRITSQCIPDLFIGIDNTGTRCLILKIPSGTLSEFLSVLKQNLSIEFFSDTSWVVLKLTNSQYFDLFDDLIISLYNKLHQIDEIKEQISLFVETFYKWSDFFEDGDPNRLSDESVKGLIGEMLMLVDIIKEKQVLYINEVLISWRGPFDTGHDFILPGENIEVKTKDIEALDILISSEYQLEPETNKPLSLVVINVRKNSDGFSLNDLLVILRKLIVDRLGDFTILLKAIAQKGINQTTIRSYDAVRYTPVNRFTYDCQSPHFPKLVRSQLAAEILDLKYKIRVNALDNFIIEQKDF